MAKRGHSGPVKITGHGVFLSEKLYESWKMEIVAERCGLEVPHACGACGAAWMYHSNQSLGDFLEGPPEKLRAILERKAKTPGLIAAMESAGLVRIHAESIEFVDYTAVMGQTRRAWLAGLKAAGKRGGEASGRARRGAERGPEMDSERSEKDTPLQAQPTPRLKREGRSASSQSDTPLEQSDLNRSDLNRSDLTHKPASRGSESVCASVDDATSSSHDGIPGGLDPHFQTQAFLDFYKSHPQPSRRRETWQEWLVLFGAGEDPVLIARIMECLEAWKESQQWKIRGMIKAPDRWLSDRPWENPPPPRAGAETTGKGGPTPAELVDEWLQEREGKPGD